MQRNNVEIVAATFRDPVEAASLLIFTKSTRLDMDGNSFNKIIERCKDDPAWMMSELDYMSKTIKSSWEFLDITFTIRGVSRACAQQITRTRFTPIDGDLYGSYAMQSQRVTDMSSMGWLNPLEEGTDQWRQYEDAMQASMAEYQSLVANDVKLEDARGVLPVNLHCNLIAKYNLRMLVDLVQARSSYRAQGEFNDIAAQMRAALIAMWPWAHLFLRPKEELAKAAVEDLRTALRASLDEQKLGRQAIHDIMIKLAKLDDILQGGK